MRSNELVRPEYQPGHTLHQLKSALTSLLDRPLSTLSDAEIQEQLREVEQYRGMLTVVEHRYLAEVSDRRDHTGHTVEPLAHSGFPHFHTA